MINVKDDRGFNQGFRLVNSTEIRMKRRANWFIEKMSVQKNASLLEIGCGRGEISYWIAEKLPVNVLGTDLCKPFIEFASKNFVLPNLQYEVLNFHNADHIKERAFDAIVGNGILHHLYHNLEKCLVTMRGLLHPKGKIIFMEPNIYNPYIALIFQIPYLRKKASLEPDEMAFSKSYIKKLLEKTGFSHIQIEYKDFLLL